MSGQSCMAALLVLVCLLGTALSASPEVGGEREGRIVAAQSIKTIITTTMTTITAPVTCAEKIQITACKRRKRSTKMVAPSLVDIDEFRNLDTSLAATDDLAADDEVADRRTGRLAYTVWWSTTSTYTITSTTADAATTFSISFACSIVGATYPPAC